jgi:putative FmdB family regulatory protein
MPTYEYECRRTGKRFEKFQSMTDEPLKKCPECGGPARRIISTGAGVIFKGGGFHATDYGSGNGSRAPSCGRERPCCGRDTPCDSAPCGQEPA